MKRQPILDSDPAHFTASQKIVAGLLRSRTMLLRTCLICLTSLPAAGLLDAQDNKSDDQTQSDLTDRVDELLADPKKQQEQEKQANGQVDGQLLTLDEIFAGQNPRTLDDLRAMQEHVKQLAERLKPATVSLRVGQSQGSGVIVSRDGYVLTAAHVIGKPGQTVTVIFNDGTEVSGKSLGMNHRIDSGLVKITDEGTWPYLEMGESKSLKRGQWVLSIGHPGGFDKLRGPVVRLGRIYSAHSNLIVSDCTLVGGDSGGPLFDMDGRVIGIHSKIGGRIQQNMHVPVDVYSVEWDDLEQGKEVGRRRSVTPRSAPVEWGFRVTYRLVIDELKPNGEKAGLKIGDTIKKLNGVPLKLRTELRTGMSQIKQGQTFELTIDRDGKELTVKVTAE